MGGVNFVISGRLAINKCDAQHYKSRDADVTITEKVIVLKVTWTVLKRNVEASHIIGASAINSVNLPIGSESLAVTA